MVKRLIVGYHPGFNQYGVWLSKPGIDVSIPGPAANFLLRPDLKSEQIVISGFAFIPAGFPFSLIAAYPSTLAAQPFVQLNANINPAQEYPHNLGLVGGSGAGATEITTGLTVTKDGIYLGNSSSNALWVTYIVYNRSIS
jgi:hypothetical protein